jgi:flagellar biosynthesis protein FlhF
VAELLAIRETLDEMTASTGSDKTAKLLALRGIEGAARSAVVRAMRSVGDLDASPANQLRTALGNLVSVTPWPLAGTGRAVLAVVGPAGVGKTTTIAKLATLAKMENKTVTLVTCDTFRVGAVEQIKRYASLLDVPCEIAKDAKGLAAIIASAETDLILVDTSGRPFRADTAEGLLAPERFAAIEGARALARHVILCMPASVRWADAVRTVRTFASAKATSIAVTKIDETDAPAGLLHGALASKLPLSILCTGPRVPEDIEAATCQGVALRVAQNPSPDKEGKAR